MRTTTTRIHGSAVVAACVLLAAGHRASAQYDPPPGYYDSATGAGVTLKDQLSAIMANGHLQRSYGNFRDSAALSDQDPNNPANLLEVYNRASVPGVWNCPNGNCVWNREHVWPQSLQPGEASNSSTGNLGDPHALRPADPGINNARGNLPFGSFDTTGNHRSLGAFYFPGDVDKGDVARHLFYSATRYQSLGLGLVDGIPSVNQMGDLQSLLRWNYTDPPDDFERRRNHVTYSSTLNPSFFTNNRNAYVDRPEFVWSVFGGGANDSTLYVGPAPQADGTSSVNVDLGRVIVGAVSVAEQAVALHKDGEAPTYYQITTAGDATSSVSGRYNAFDFDPQSMDLDVGLAPPFDAAGPRSGTVIMDNLDVDGAAAGQGSLDGDDMVAIELGVVDPSQASFSDAVDQDILTIDFGTITDGNAILTQALMVHNLETTSGFTAALDVDAVNTGGDTAALYTDAAPFTGLAAGTGQAFTAMFDTAAIGAFSTQVVFNVSDEDIPGATAGMPLTLNLTGEVVALCNACDVNCDSLQNGADVVEMVNVLVGAAAPCSTCAGDTSRNALTDDADVESFVACLLTAP
jgi:endonuclease I